MTELLQTICQIREKFPDYRELRLNESDTRSVLIERLLKALGWDVGDPTEIKREYPTVDGKFVDYALMVNGKPSLLVEAKPLDDPLTT